MKNIRWTGKKFSLLALSKTYKIKKYRLEASIDSFKGFFEETLEVDLVVKFEKVEIIHDDGQDERK